MDGGIHAVIRSPDIYADLVGKMLAHEFGRHCCICCDRTEQPDCVMRTRRIRPRCPARSAFAGFCFPPDVIVLAVRWYLRLGLSYRDVEELLAERGIEVDHVTVYRWVVRFTPLLAEAARPCRHLVGDRWQADETYVNVAGRWRYVYRAIDQFGQVIDVFVSLQRDTKAANRFFERAIGATKITPTEVTTEQGPVYPAVPEKLLPAAWHRTDRYANNRVECDHGRLKARLRPMRGLKQDRSAEVIIAGHALVQNLRAGTTSWRSRYPRTGGWPSRSANSPLRSDPERRSSLRHARGSTKRNSAAAGAAWRWRGPTSVASSWR
jgi:transposase-like protein